jgi:flagellar basal-body rod modification protein FlgD
VAEAIQALADRTVGLAPDLLAQASGGRTPSNTLDKEAFLKLLVAQLRFQDPMNPTSNEQFVATTAQFSTIEKLDEIAKQGETAARASALSTASALLGRQISLLDADGRPTTTTVERAELVSGQLTLQTGLGPVGIEQVIGLAGPAAPTP